MTFFFFFTGISSSSSSVGDIVVVVVVVVEAAPDIASRRWKNGAGGCPAYMAFTYGSKGILGSSFDPEGDCIWLCGKG